MTPRNISIETLGRRLAYEVGVRGTFEAARSYIERTVPGISQAMWSAAIGQASLAIETAAEAAHLQGHQQLREALHEREPPSHNVGVMVAVWWRSGSPIGDTGSDLARTEMYVPSNWDETVGEMLATAESMTSDWTHGGGGPVVIERFDIVSPVWWPAPFQG